MPKIAIVLTPGFADWEYAYIAGTGAPFYGMDIRFFAPEPGEITSQGGLTARVEHDTDEIAAWKPDVLVVVGGTGWEQDSAPDVSDALKAQHERGGTVAGLCGGTLALARVGLLDGVRHTSNDPTFLTENVLGYRGQSHYKASPKAIADGSIITAPGTAATSFAAAVFEAAGLDADTVQQFRGMTAAEHA